jgi:hypothetical protein
MKAPTLLILSAAMFLFSAAAAHGQERAEQKSPAAAEATFKSLDKNRDQALSKIEAKGDKSISAAFDQADINLDGFVSKSEYMVFLQRSTEATRGHAPPTEPLPQ